MRFREELPRTEKGIKHLSRTGFPLASYTVHYAGGTTVVPMNQTQNGGQWNLLGTFTLNPASNPMVELSDQANGRVVADAVMVVPSGVSTDHVTYTPTLTSSETVDIYAKWTESATRAQAVAYTVQHAGGATDMLVNQQQPSAGWFRLGAFTMNPGQNHGVEVMGALEGVTVADAVRFVSAGTSAPGIQYVHTDHLGSPQKMTDATKAIVWDAVFTPFGQVHSITGTATNNQRFPGQYFDQETGYHYNYFRDYDPTTGRYVESDPIGLGGGLNTYGYAGGNPVSFIDPEGLFWRPLIQWFLKIFKKSPPKPNGPKKPYCPPDAKEPISSLQKSIDSLQKQIDSHKEKLRRFKENPDAFDNKEFLKNAPSEEIRQKIIEGRIKHLETEISNFQKAINEILNGGGG